MEANKTKYISEPTLAAFHKSNAFVRGVMGPIGSGKSVACAMECFKKATEQKPNKSNVRATRWAVIRNTYGELKSTTIRTWQEWIPPENMPIIYDTPIRGRMIAPLGDDTTIDMEVFFVSLDKPKDIRKLKSLELTGAWLNEASELPKAILDMATGRIRRYPPKRWGGPTWYGIIMDTNAMDDDHWWYQLAEVEKPQGYEFFRQPPALIRDGDTWLPNEGQFRGVPRAENVVNHLDGFQYWLDLVPGKSQEWCLGYISAEYVNTYDGKPVYPEYKDSVHFSESELQPYRGLPLYVGLDFGLNPAAAFFQLSPRGQLRILDELVSVNMGIKQFVRDIMKPHILANYHGLALKIVGDPAGNSRSQTDEQTCYDILRQEGFAATPADTNDFIPRREAVAQYLIKMVDGEAGLLLSSKCKMLRKGFRGAYMRERVQVLGEDRYKDVPKKNLASHVHEGLQYGCRALEFSHFDDSVYDIPRYQAADQRAGY